MHNNLVQPSKPGIAHFSFFLSLLAFCESLNSATSHIYIHSRAPKANSIVGAEREKRKTTIKAHKSIIFLGALDSQDASDFIFIYITIHLFLGYESPCSWSREHGYQLECDRMDADVRLFLHTFHEKMNEVEKWDGVGVVDWAGRLRLMLLVLVCSLRWSDFNSGWCMSWPYIFESMNNKPWTNAGPAWYTRHHQLQSHAKNLTQLIKKLKSTTKLIKTSPHVHRQNHSHSRDGVPSGPRRSAPSKSEHKQVFRCCCCSTLRTNRQSSSEIGLSTRSLPKVRWLSVNWSRRARREGKKNTSELLFLQSRNWRSGNKKIGWDGIGRWGCGSCLVRWGWGEFEVLGSDLF
jgi:hypothetical protein